MNIVELITAEGVKSFNNSKYILLNIIKILEILKPDVDEIKQPPKKVAAISIKAIFSLSLFVKLIPELEMAEDNWIIISEKVKSWEKINNIKAKRINESKK